MFEGLLVGSNVRRAFYAASVLAIVIYPFVYIGNYSGDAQVHLVYGQNASNGAFFEFNLGEKSAGVTSPGFMLLIASFFKIFPDTWVPAIIKIVDLLFWYGLTAVIFMTAKSLLRSTNWAVIAALAGGLLPGSAYNATNGMENGIFAFFVLAWFLVAVRNGWFDTSRVWRDSYRSELILGGILGLACWLRPEGFVVVAIALAFRAMLSTRTRSDFASSVARSVVFLVPLLAFAGGLLYLHWSQTDHLFPTSGNSRILMSKLAQDTFRYGSFFFTPKMTVRLAQYFALTLPSLVAIWLVLKGRGNLHDSRPMFGFLAILFWAFFVLYSFVLGSAHMSRYIIFIMPALVLLATFAAKWSWELRIWQERGYFRYTPRIAMALLAVVLVAVFTKETQLRLELDSQSALWWSMRAPEERKAFSDELFRLLGSPETLPISVALQEVQARYWLDERFIVRSLDGRIDPVLLDYATEIDIDHVGYLKEQKVQYLIQATRYNRDIHAWSLKDLNLLEPGEEFVRDGVTFTKLEIDRSELARAVETYGGDSRWFDAENGILRLHYKFLSTLIRVDYPDPE